MQATSILPACVINFLLCKHCCHLCNYIFIIADSACNLDLLKGRKNKYINFLMNRATNFISLHDNHRGTKSMSHLNNKLVTFTLFP